MHLKMKVVLLNGLREREGVLQFSLTAADGDPLDPLDTSSPALVLLPSAVVPSDGSVTAVAPGQHSVTENRSE